MIIRILLIALLLSCSAFAAAPEFPIGVWYEGGVGAFRQNTIPEDVDSAAKIYDRDFADIAAHGVNAVVVPNTPPAHHKALLDAAQKHNLNLIIELGPEGAQPGQMIRGQLPLDANLVTKTFQSTLAPIQKHPALWKVQLLDEPAPGEPVQRYAKIAEMLRTFDPAHEPFCCLAGVGNVGVFAKTTNSKIVAWDFYPISVKHEPVDSQPIKAFAGAAEKANKLAARNAAQTWAVIQAHAITNNHRFPTPAELRCMTYLSLATGSRGIFWFLYQSQYLDPAHKVQMSGLVDEQYKHSDRWDECAKLSKEITALAPVLNKLSVAKDQSLATGDGFVRLLEDDKGQRYVFAVNVNTTLAQKLSLRFGKDSEVANDAQIVRVSDNAKLPAAHEGAALTWEQELPAGSGALFRIE